MNHSAVVPDEYWLCLHTLRCVAASHANRARDAAALVAPSEKLCALTHTHTNTLTHSETQTTVVSFAFTELWSYTKKTNGIS